MDFLKRKQHKITSVCLEARVGILSFDPRACILSLIYLWDYLKVETCKEVITWKQMGMGL